jgi:hypothetical protein
MLSATVILLIPSDYHVYFSLFFPHLDDSKEWSQAHAIIASISNYRVSEWRTVVLTAFLV